MRVSKQRKKILESTDFQKQYPLKEALRLVKEHNTTRFDAGVDVALRLGIDPRKGDQMVRGTVQLPHGTGRKRSVLVICHPEKSAEATAAGADYVGLDEYVEKIQQGWTDVDVILTQPSLMAKLAKLGRVLGPRGLMPNPKSGTVTDDVGKGVADIKKGKVDLKADKYGIIHANVGRCSFEVPALLENVEEVLQIVQKLKPSAAKGTYLRSIYVSSTMGVSVSVEK